MRKEPAVAAIVALAALSAWWSLRSCDAPLPSLPGNAEAGDAARPAAAAAAVPANAAAGDPTVPTRIDEVPAVVAPVAERTREHRSLLLHVVDADRGFELDDVAVRGTGEGRSASWSGVSDLSEMKPLVSGRSPLTVLREPPKVFLETLVVTAPGYAPLQFLIDWRSGGERTVALQRAATIELVVKGRPAGTPAIVQLRRIETSRRWVEEQSEFARLRDEGHGSRATDRFPRLAQIGAQLASEIVSGPIEGTELLAALLCLPVQRTQSLAPDGPTMIDGVEPGMWAPVVREERTSPLWAAGCVRVAIGSTSRLELEWRKLARSARVTVAGRIVVDPRWFAGAVPPMECRLTLVPRGDRLPPAVAWPVSYQDGDATSRGADGVYDFEMADIKPGSYVLFLQQWKVFIALEVPPTGASDLILRVPPPAEVDLALVDALDGTPIPDVGVTYFTLEVESSYYFLGLGGVKSGADGHAHFQAALGLLDVAIQGDDDHAPHYERFALAPGRNERTIRFARTTYLELHLKEGATEVPWDTDHRLLLERAGERHAFSNSGISGRMATMTFGLDLSGRWRASVQNVPGFESSTPVDIELVAGETTSIEIPLRRAR